MATSNQPSVSKKILDDNHNQISGSDFRDKINEAIPRTNQWSFNMDLEWPNADTQWGTYGNFFVFLVNVNSNNYFSEFLQQPQTLGQSYDLILSLASITDQNDLVYPPSDDAIRQFNNIAHVAIQTGSLKFYCYSKEWFLPKNTTLQLRGTFVPSYLPPDGHYYSMKKSDGKIEVTIPVYTNK